MTKQHTFEWNNLAHALQVVGFDIFIYYDDRDKMYPWHAVYMKSKIESVEYVGQTPNEAVNKVMRYQKPLLND